MRTPSKWDDVFMLQAIALSLRSKDPSTQCGAIIVTQENEPLGSGFNGPPTLIPDSMVDFDTPAKYPFIIHAEANAMDFAGTGGMRGARLIVTARPCSRCTLRMVREQLAEIVYGAVTPRICDQTDWELTQRIAKMGGVTLTPWKSTVERLQEMIREMSRRIGETHYGRS